MNLSRPLSASTVFFLLSILATRPSSASAGFSDLYRQLGLSPGSNADRSDSTLFSIECSIFFCLQSQSWSSHCLVKRRCRFLRRRSHLGFGQGHLRCRKLLLEWARHRRKLLLKWAGHVRRRILLREGAQVRSGWTLQRLSLKHI